MRQNNGHAGSDGAASYLKGPLAVDERDVTYGDAGHIGDGVMGPTGKQTDLQTEVGCSGAFG